MQNSDIVSFWHDLVNDYKKTHNLHVYKATKYKIVYS